MAALIVTRFRFPSGPTFASAFELSRYFWDFNLSTDPSHLDYHGMVQPLDKPGQSSSIALYLVNGVATVWDAQVAATLHCTHNISGLRTGTLPGVSQQNGFLGLPMTLMQEETAYLVQQGIAHLVPLATTPLLPTPEAVEQNTHARMKKYRALEEAARAEMQKRETDRKKQFEKAGELAKEKREKRARAKAEAEAAAAMLVEEGSLGDASLIPTSTAPPLTPPEPPLATASTSLQFHAVPSHPLFPPRSSPITSVPHALFPFPQTARERALVGIFTSLQRQNLRIGLGPRFGGEYLVYPGDYLRYHAHFTSQILVRDECLKPTEIVAWGRLGTGTKKAGLICCWDDGAREDEDEIVGGDKEERIEYYSLEWANFG
ncbi:tRNA-splicing endonuclease subunit Sen34, partial [Tremellales sp. Uapishka_1]